MALFIQFRIQEGLSPPPTLEVAPLVLKERKYTKHPPKAPVFAAYTASEPKVYAKRGCVAADEAREKIDYQRGSCLAKCLQCFAKYTNIASADRTKRMVLISSQSFSLKYIYLSNLSVPSTNFVLEWFNTSNSV